jgi:hypothetical protein
MKISCSAIFAAATLAATLERAMATGIARTLGHNKDHIGAPGTYRGRRASHFAIGYGVYWLVRRRRKSERVRIPNTHAYSTEIDSLRAQWESCGSLATHP